MTLATTDAIRHRTIPGGWTDQTVTCNSHVWNLLLPADADEFLNQLESLPSGCDEDVYWSRLWPTALTMSTLLPQAGWPAGSRVLELGCGIGLVGLAALATGCRVTFSDYMEIAVELAKVNAARNGFTDAEGMILDWKHPFPEQFDGIIASDILYDPGNHGPIASVLDAMLAPHGTVWIGDPGRRLVSAFIEVVWDRGFDIELLNESGQPVSDVKWGGFQLLQLRRCWDGEMKR